MRNIFKKSVLLPFKSIILGRIIAFDVGKKKVGIATTDNSQIIANGLTTLKVAEVLPFLMEYLKSEDVEAFVVGLAKQTDGSDS